MPSSETLLLCGTQSRIAREIAKAEGRVYLGDPLKHPVTNEVTVKPCGTPQPDPWAFVISAKENARKY